LGVEQVCGQGTECHLTVDSKFFRCSQRHKHVTGIQTSLFCTPNSTIRLVAEHLPPSRKGQWYHSWKNNQRFL